MMNVVHYSLGFPPFRTGGMIKYCMDLMAEEYKLGNTIYLLWPGALRKTNDDIEVKIHKDYHYNNTVIHNIELRNPLPVPLLNGIKEVEYFVEPKNVEVLKKFFEKNKIDVLHVHTLMGLPVEVIELCEKMKIKTIFTTHDYFGLCPRWGLERNGVACENDNNCKDCIACNNNALSIKKIKFLQSKLYKKLKCTPIFKLLRNINNNKLYIKSDTANLNLEKTNENEKYLRLRKYYKDILEKIDIIHFNSLNTKKIYSRFINTNNSKVINISNSSIRVNKKIRNVNSIVRFGYLGPITKHKGYFFLKDICDKLVKDKYMFELHIFSDIKERNNYIIKHQPYNYNQLESVMDKFDVLLVPSQWYETFGFTVLEALSYGIPVVVTENVGAKDLIVNGHNGIISENNSKAFLGCLKKILDEKEIIDKMNRYIVNNYEINTMEKHVKEIVNLYY